MDVRLCQMYFRRANRATLLLATRLCRSAAFLLYCSGLICGCDCCTFALLNSRARLCLKKLVIPIAVDIQGSQISFRFTNRGDLPLWSTCLFILEFVFCFVNMRLGDLAGPTAVHEPPWLTQLRRPAAHLLHCSRLIHGWGSCTFAVLVG